MKQCVSIRYERIISIARFIIIFVEAFNNVDIINFGYYTIVNNSWKEQIRVKLLKKIAIKQHNPPDRENINLSIGDIVEVGNEDTGNPNWKNWVWCVTKETNMSGWGPIQYLSIVENIGTVVKDYSSVELQVEPDDKLTIHYYLNGWVWATDASDHQGWVPEECLG